MLPIIQVGPLAVQLPGLIILVGLWLGIALAERHAARFSVQAAQLTNLVFISLAAGLVGARLVYALRYWNIFAENPSNLISINPGLLDPLAGAMIGGLAGLVFGQRKHMAPWPTLDALTPALAVLAVAIGLSHLASGAAFGLPTDLPWGIELWGASRHPTQIYETIFALAILILLWPGKNAARFKTPGTYCLTFLALSAASRLFVEGLRGDSALLFGGLRANQVIAWIILAASLWLIYRLVKDQNHHADQDQ